MHLIDEAYKKALEVLRMNITDLGFTACAPTYDDDPESNYRSVWARDSALTFMWCLQTGDSELIECGKKSMETIIRSQTEDGHLPNYVDVASGRPEYGGTGNIAGVDGAMWVIIAMANYLKVSGDAEFVRRYMENLERSMRWLRALDSNNCGLLEIPESSDWMDLFPRSYHVLYDEILWYRANIDFVPLCQVTGRDGEVLLNRAARIRHLVNRFFWPDRKTHAGGEVSFASTQFTLGTTRYLLSQITPFGFSWRCDVFANIIACLYGVVDAVKAESVWKFLRQVAIDEPFPVRVIYPAIRPGESDWRDYFLVNLLNLPHHYHNGGIWPMVGGLWVRYLTRLGHQSDAERALLALAELCRDGIDREWEFNEWAHGETGRPMGKAYQAWSAASFIAAHHRVQGDSILEPPLDEPEEVLRAAQLGLANGIASAKRDLDRE